MDMFEKRNLMTHTYDEEIFNEAIHQISTLYFSEIKKIFEFFKKQNEL